MSEQSQMDLNSLHHAVLRETEDDSLLELEPGFYRDLAEFIGGLRKQEFDGVEGKIKDAMLGMVTDLAHLMLAVRLEKSRSGGGPQANLLDEEKYILDSHEEGAERAEMVASATAHGKSKFLESLSQGNKTKKVVVRFLKEVGEIVGADLEKYGPFEVEDIATIPYENAQALISQDAAAKVRWED